MTGVVAGAYDIARTSLPAIFAAHLREIPIAIVAPGILWRTVAPFSLLQVAPDSPYRTGADLEGKTIGVPALNDLNTVAVRAWVDRNGGNWRSLKFVEVPNIVAEAAIVQRRVDAVVLFSPQLGASLAAGTSRTLGDACGAIARTFMLGAHVARRDWATAHPELVQRFNRVNVDASNFVNTHPRETEPDDEDEPAVVANMSRAYMGTLLTPG